MPLFKDPRIYRDILDALEIGVSVAENIDSRIACDLFCDVTPEKNFLAQISIEGPSLTPRRATIGSAGSEEKSRQKRVRRAKRKPCQERIAIPVRVIEITLQITPRHSRNLHCIIARPFDLSLRSFFMKNVRRVWFAFCS